MNNKTIIVLLFSHLVFGAIAFTSEQSATIYIRDGKYTVEYGLLDPTGVAFGIYNPTLYQTGWDTLSLSSNKSPSPYSDYEKAYGIGFLEGVLTSERIYNQFLNKFRQDFYYTGEKMPEYIADFFSTQRKWIEKTFLENPDDGYWQNVYAVQLQLDGLIDGYNSIATSDKQISYTDFQVLAADSDIGDITLINPKLRPNYQTMTPEEITHHIDLRMHCSALIKLTANFSDLFFGHATWGNYVNMVRIFKEYNIVFSTIPTKAKNVMFSSYPGTLSSIDDFYVTSAKLGVMETTNPIFNNDLYDLIVPESILYWHRVQVANRMADSGEEWNQVYSKYNSGTYNNQNMVVDLKKVDPINGYVSEGTLWVSEQIPGKITSADVTEILRYGYWPSYNTPYFPDIREISGVNEYNAKHPELRHAYDYETCVRANIFRRDQGKIQSYQEFREIFRYNDYQNDPFSFKNPKWSVASRNDLNTSFTNCTGATDAKTTSLSKINLMNAASVSMISGPTNERQPTFEWKSAYCATDPRYQWVKMPEKYDFQWEEFEPFFFNTQS